MIVLQGQEIGTAGLEPPKGARRQRKVTVKKRRNPLLPFLSMFQKYVYIAMQGGRFPVAPGLWVLKIIQIYGIWYLAKYVSGSTLIENICFYSQKKEEHSCGTRTMGTGTRISVSHLTWAVSSCQWIGVPKKILVFRQII